MAEYLELFVDSDDLTEMLNMVQMMITDIERSLQCVADLCLDRGVQEIDLMTLNGLLRMLANGAHVTNDKVAHCLTVATKKGAAA